MDVIPHFKEILNNSICLSVERVVHTDNKRTSLFGYRLYNFYCYQDGKNKTLHCLVSTVVQNTDNAEGHVFKNIENVTIGRGLPGKNADMSASVNGDTYSISQLYQFVKGLERKDGGILEEGHVTTDEPGIYLEGQYGIRLENELVYIEKLTLEHRRIYRII